MYVFMYICMAYLSTYGWYAMNYNFMNNIVLCPTLSPLVSYTNTITITDWHFMRSMLLHVIHPRLSRSLAKNCVHSYLAVVGGPDSSVLLQLKLYTADPPNVHTSPHSQHSLHISSSHLALVSESVLSLQS